MGLYPMTRTYLLLRLVRIFCMQMQLCTRQLTRAHAHHSHWRPQHQVGQPIAGAQRDVWDRTAQVRQAEWPRGGAEPEATERRRPGLCAQAQSVQAPCRRARSTGQSCQCRPKSQLQRERKCACASRGCAWRACLHCPPSQARS